MQIVRESMRQKVIIPEIVEPDAALPADLQALRRFAVLMDEAFSIPGTRRKFGLDAVIGLVPGIGDSVGAIMSLWIIVGALRHRVPATKIARMLLNVFIDLTVGSIPILGDIFDFFFTENVSNADLLIRHRDRSRAPRSFVSIAAVAALILAGALTVAIFMLVLVAWGIYRLAELRF